MAELVFVNMNKTFKLTQLKIAKFITMILTKLARDASVDITFKKMSTIYGLVFIMSFAKTLYYRKFLTWKITCIT